MRPTHLKTLTLSTLCLLASCGGGSGGGGAAQPAAQIQFPPEASLTDADGMTVRGTIQRPAAVSGLSVAGVPASTTNGWKTWSVEVPLDIGQNNLKASMTGPAGGAVGKSDAVTVYREDVVLGDCGGLAMGDPGEGKAWWLDADRGRLIEISLATGERTSRAIVDSAFDFSEGLDRPGEPVFDGNRNQVYVGDGSRIHRISVAGGVRSQLCDRGPLGWVMDVDYDPTSDRLLSLESDGLFGNMSTQVYSINPHSGARELICSFAPDGLDGDIAAHSISVFRDGTGASAFVASTEGLSLVSLQDGSRTPVPGPLTDIRDLACWNFKVFVLDREQGVFDVNLWTGEYSHLYDFGQPDSPLLRGLTLCGGPGLNEVAFTDDALDAAYRLDTGSGQIEEICRSTLGEGPTLVAAASELRFKGKQLVLDAEWGRIMSISPEGKRTTFSEGNHLQTPEAAVVIGDFLYVGCSGIGSIVRVDAQGAQTLVIPGTADLKQLQDLAYSDPANGGGGTLLALCRKKLVEVDLDSSTTSLITEAGDGRGSDFDFAQQLVPHPGLEIAMFTTVGKASAGEGSVFMVFLDGGMRVMIAGEDPIGGAMGSGAEVSSPRGMAYGTDSTELMIAAGPQGPGSMSLYRLDVPSLQRSEISSADRGRGPLLDLPGTVRRDAQSGNLYVTGRTEGAVLVIDPESGDRVMTSR